MLGAGASSDTCWASELAEHTCVALPNPKMVEPWTLRGKGLVCHVAWIKCIIQQQQQHCTTKDVLASPAHGDVFIHAQQADAVTSQI